MLDIGENYELSLQVVGHAVLVLVVQGPAAGSAANTGDSGQREVLI
jgi:hypothetical protein